jgi:hypothetical protein
MSSRGETFLITGYEAAADLAWRLALSEIPFAIRPLATERRGSEVVQLRVGKTYWKAAFRHHKDIVAGQTAVGDVP